MYQAVLKNPQNIDLKTRYNRYKNQLDREIKTAKRSFMQNSIEKNKNKSSALWKNVNQICNKTKQKTVVEKIKIPNSEILTDPYQMANKFNDFFL